MYSRPHVWHALKNINIILLILLLLSKEHYVLCELLVSCYTQLHSFLYVLHSFLYVCTFCTFYIFFPVCQLTFFVFAVQTLDREDQAGPVCKDSPTGQISFKTTPSATIQQINSPFGSGVLLWSHQLCPRWGGVSHGSLTCTFTFLHSVRTM